MLSKNVNEFRYKEPETKKTFLGGTDPFPPFPPETPSSTLCNLHVWNPQGRGWARKSSDGDLPLFPRKQSRLSVSGWNSIGDPNYSSGVRRGLAGAALNTVPRLRTASARGS